MSLKDIEFQNSGIHTEAATATLTSRTLSNLLLDQGKVEHNGIDYVIDKQGLMVFFEHQATAYTYTPYYDGSYRIAYDSGDPDAYAIMEAFCRMHGFGTTDNAITPTEMLTAIKSRHVYTLCGDAAAGVRSLLTDAGISSRQVHFLTADTPNGVVEGHVAIEVYINGKWCFFDQSGDSYFFSGTTHLSVYDMISRGVSNCGHTQMCPSEAEGGGTYAAVGSVMPFPARPYYDAFLCDPVKYRNWTSQIFQIPGIWDENDTDNIDFYMPAGTSGRQTWLESLQANYNVLSESEWVAKYY